MDFLRDLWILFINALLGKELEEKDPYAMDDLPVVAAPDERVKPTAAEAPTPTPILEDLPVDPIPFPPVMAEEITIANPKAVAKATIVAEPVPAESAPTPSAPINAAVGKDQMIPLRPFAPAPTPPSEDFGVATPLVRALEKLGHTVFKNGERPFNLNIVGERNTNNPTVDKFGCRIHVFWKWGGQWRLRTWAATTYPGSRYLVEKLLNPQGAAILAEGQYRNIYAMDLHGGRYRALCQRLGPVIVYRDGNRDRRFDLKPTTRTTGMYGINIHAPITVKAGMKTYIANTVYAASAGCQVFQRLQDFLEFRDLCDNAEKEWGNSFTYTLIRDIDVDWSASMN